MTPTGELSQAERVTLDEIRHRAESVKSLAVAEAKDAVNEVVGKDAARTLAIVAGLVVVAASLAFFLGSRTARATAVEDLLG